MKFQPRVCFTFLLLLNILPAGIPSVLLAQSAKITLSAMNINDIHSFARPEEAVVKHLSLDLTVDFEKKILHGKAILSIINKVGGSFLHLDTRDLIIEKITLGTNEEKTSFRISDPVPFLGSDLAVEIAPTTSQVTVYYTTSPGAAALQWLEPEQTAGGKFPFLFTQSQAILARTWIPLQDSPNIRFTYDAVIHCPPALMALMSAENDTMKNPKGEYLFKMPQAIPSYLMALSVGDLTFHAYTPTCGVFAEPVMMDKCAYEFTDMPNMISAAESIYGKYRWGRYDLLVLPPSFPFGGMENPRITFATPTIIAGDRSLVALVAHELAHSWSGNLVTNATWNDFWLNEGFTVYFETRIMEKLYGKDYADMLTVLSYEELKNTVREMGDSPDSKLYLDLKGRDPDDGVTDIAYQKGRFFLTTIEQAVGREKWDAFVNAYFNTFAFQSMDTKHFLEYLDKMLIKGNADLERKINIQAWVFGTGLPANCPVIHSAELDKASKASADFKGGKKATSLETTGWTTHHWLYFLRQVNDTLSPERLAELDAAFHFTESGNSEILCDWFQVCLKNKYSKAYPALEKFLLHVGRRKFLRPLYSEMARTEEGKKMARVIYERARLGYHAVSVQTIDEILAPWPPKGE